MTEAGKGNVRGADPVAVLRRIGEDALTVCLGLVHAHHQLGGRLSHAVVQVFQTLDALQIWGELRGVRFQRIEPLAEQLDLDGLRRTGEIVDHVRQDLDELDMEPRYRGVDRASHVVHDGENFP